MTTPAAETTPVTDLSGVGPAVAAKLERLGIRTIADALFHLPHRYQDRTRITRIGELGHGMEAVIEAEVEHAAVVTRRRRSLVAHLSDGTGGLTVRLFYFGRRQQDQFTAGTRMRLYGEARRGPSGLEMVHPEYRVLAGDAAPPLDAALTPVYPATEGVSQNALRRLAASALDWLARTDGLADVAGPAMPTGMPELTAALEFVHRPPSTAPVQELIAGTHPACRRLAFEELLAHHVSLRRLRHQARSQRAPVLAGDGRLVDSLRRELPFALTPAQERVVDEITADIGQGQPMLRLLQGDVGSGKTVVAAVAALTAIEAGHQAVVMAPTEVLAEQHLRTLSAWLEPLGIRMGWLTGRLTATARRREAQAIAAGQYDLVIGTHALFQRDVTIPELGLVIIDEQHRFGVHQRLALREKGAIDGRVPHQLIMTATPIPRTLAMTAYADLDTSVIDALPPGRQPVETAVVSSTRRDEVVERVARACADGQQVYWVCTRIEEGEEDDSHAGRAAAEAASWLQSALPDLRVALVHGRLKAQDKEAVMAGFQRGEVDVLVATTVIEVGVDVPNATLMVIENAERLGLSQLHQLRGRVGRGAAASLCLLLYDGPLSEMARARLTTLRETADGFRIAERDLELRGPGEVLGTRQAGALTFRIADPVRDAEVLPRVREAAERLLNTDADTVDRLVDRWLGAGERYGEA